MVCVNSHTISLKRWKSLGLTSSRESPQSNGGTRGAQCYHATVVALVCFTCCNQRRDLGLLYFGMAELSKDNDLRSNKRRRAEFEGLVRSSESKRCLQRGTANKMAPLQRG